jgi:hypothetical protein
MMADEHEVDEVVGHTLTTEKEKAVEVTVDGRDAIVAIGREKVRLDRHSIPSLQLALQRAFVGVVEKSTLYTHFADPADMACPEPGCSRQREISDMERPTDYGTAFGGSDALLRLRQIGAHGASRDSLMAAAQDAKARPATAREQLDEAYVLGRIDEPEYQRKRAVLEGVVPESAQPRSRAKKTVED